MPLVRISMLSGRSDEKKHELAQEITKSFERVWNNKPEAITIIFDEVEKADWVVGGVPYSKK
ncbi:4-oxalocrotonate tautomerase [Paenochrobactrum gallinarii]|uniref:4-oxalocrotonate tautomerase n=2 Tax=Paenochrobactrum gallinarii TaxID=643673 RepID=A0A841LVW6_9HYPH|nr:4-oxalocrotonate tautomerase [Paenochrobactrum gallinarii]